MGVLGKGEGLTEKRRRRRVGKPVLRMGSKSFQLDNLAHWTRKRQNVKTETDCEKVGAGLLLSQLLLL